MIPRVLAVLLALFFCLPMLGARADLVILKNGGQIEGEILQETEERVHVSTEEQGVLALPRDIIDRVIRAKVRRLPTETPIPPTPTRPATWTPFVAPELTPPGVEAQPTATASFTATSTAQPPIQEIPEAAPPVQPPPGLIPAGDQIPAGTGISEATFSWEGPKAAETQARPVNWLYVMGVLLALLIGQSLFVSKCIRVGEKNGHSKGFAIFCGVFFGLFGLLLLQNIQPGSAKKFAIGCCLAQVLLIACAIFLIAGLIGSAVLAFMGAVEEHQIEDMSYYDEGGYDEVFKKQPTPSEEELLEGSDRDVFFPLEPTVTPTVP